MKKNIPYGVTLGILCLICGTAFGLLLLHMFDFIYRADMILLGIPQSAGLSEEVVLRNYKAMLAFLSPFSTAPFSLPDMIFSENGAVHFEECRNIFRGVYACGGLSVFGIIAIRRMARRNRIDRGYLAVAATTLTLLPSIAFIAIAINANAVFVLFHKIFFRNNYWIFSSVTDPVITILPMEFFIHCAAFIMLWWIVAGGILLFMYKKEKRRKSHYAYLTR